MLAAILAFLGTLGLMGASGGGRSEQASPPTLPTNIVQDPDPEPEDTGTITEPTAPEEPTQPVEPVVQPGTQPTGRSVTQPEPTVQPTVQPVVATPVAPDTDTGTGTPAPAPAVEVEVEVEVEVDPAPVVVEPSPPVAVTGPTTNASMNVDATSGRVTTIELDSESQIVDVQILAGPQYGNLSVNPDNSLALVLTGTDDTSDLNLTFQTIHADGSSTIYQADVAVSDGSLAGGWGVGDHYMLETDADDNVVVEHGENHREVHVSGDEEALTLRDIAILEDMNVRDINGAWLADHPEYGSSPDMALAQDAGSMLWSQLTGTGTDPSSHHLLFEAGYEYNEMGGILDRGTVGESELHPVYIGAYGDGERPVINSELRIFQDVNENIVIQGLDLQHGILALEGTNIIFDDLDISGDEVNLQNLENVTLRNSSITDVVREETRDGDDEIWNSHLNRISGVYANDNDGLLFEGLLFDHNGWAADYEEDLSVSGGQPPTIYSHNLYINYGNADVTLRDTISTQSASYGAMVRSGGFIEDNTFIENNAGLTFLSGTMENGVYQGNYTLLSGNLITSGAHNDVSDGPRGGLTLGLYAEATDATLINNIITHLADPNNPDELDERYWGHPALDMDTEAFFNDTIIYNWVAARNAASQDLIDTNTDGLDEDTLNQTTIQNFAADLLGNPDATISDLADHLRAQADGAFADVVDADLILAFFQEGFGLTPDLAETAGPLRFVPNELGDGVRWDNRLNWENSNDEIPEDGDSVDLGGNWVVYGGTTNVDNLDLGNDGLLTVNHGRLEISGNLTNDGANSAIEIDGSGQVWLDGYTDSDMLTLTVEGGRFANTDLFLGTTELTASDNAQVILATDDGAFSLSDDSVLRIIGDNTRVGFDGEAGDTGVLVIDEGSTVEFIAEDGLGQIGEFFSGAYDGDGTAIQSGVNIEGGELHLDITDLGGEALSQTLISADELIGSFDNIEITGLASDQDAVVTYDYDADTLTLTLTAAGEGNGAINTETVGNQSNARSNEDLWIALTRDYGTLSEEMPEEQVEEPVDPVF